MARVATRRALLSRPRAAAGGCFALDFVGSGWANSINCGSDASLDDLHAGAFTYELYSYHEDAFTDAWLLCKGPRLRLYRHYIYAYVYAATTNATVISGNNTYTSAAWHHVAMTYDNGGDRKIRAFCDGAEVSYNSQVAAEGDILTDASVGAYVGKYEGGPTHNGYVGWVRISNVVRYTSNFTPAARCAPPDTDSNTIMLLKLTEGSGTTVADSSANGNDATLTSVEWLSI